MRITRIRMARLERRYPLRITGHVRAIETTGSRARRTCPPGAARPVIERPREAGRALDAAP